MLKIIGAILLIGGASVIGLTASGKLSTRFRVLSAFSRVLDVMQSEIGNMLTPLDELCAKLASIAPEPVDAFFGQCAKAIEKNGDTPFGITWAKTVARATYLELRPEERQVLTDLGATLGRYSAEEQGRAIAHAARAMSAAAAAAEAEWTKVGRLYGRLGIICGIAIVIVFI